ncbi:IS630 family transposase [Rhizophagus irregularis DAOM 181602=DAOM 197198]|nr:IS630 family transposase [Rhizophagus irregularis DAOM 181602=DAOM 197198]
MKPLTPKTRGAILMTYLNAFSFIKENNENRRLFGLTACVPRHKPAMTEAHCQARLEWAYEHENWTERKWKRVLFSDESTFTQFQQGRQGMGNGIFQEDNAAPHRSRVATAARENAEIVTLDWPAQSPDINPIENIWAEMKMMIRRHSPPPSSISVLMEYVTDAWNDIPPEYYRKLIKSMPQREGIINMLNLNFYFHHI